MPASRGPAYDPRKDGIHPLERELIKIRGTKGTWACMYYSPGPKACSIYAHRPLECRELTCADSGDIFLAMETPSISREDLVSTDSALWECIAEHERLFPVQKALSLARQGSLPEELDMLIRREIFFRESFARRVEATDEALWAYFGRPLWMVLAPLDRRFEEYGEKAKFASNC